MSPHKEGDNEGQAHTQGQQGRAEGLHEIEPFVGGHLEGDSRGLNVMRAGEVHHSLADRSDGDPRYGHVCLLTSHTMGNINTLCSFNKIRLNLINLQWV